MRDFLETLLLFWGISIFAAIPATLLTLLLVSWFVT